MQIALEDADYLETVLSIGLPSGNGIVPAGTIFSSEGELLAALNKDNKKQIPNPLKKGELLTITPISTRAIREMISSGTIRCCKLVDGHMVHAELKRSAPTPVGMSDSTVDEDTGKESAVEVKPNMQGVKYGYNPDNLKDKSLEDLNAIMVGKDAEYMATEGPFEDKAEAIAFLSQEYTL